MEEEKEKSRELNELSGVDLLKFVKEVSGQAEKEIARVSMMYKLAAGCFTIIFAIGIAFTYKDSSEFRKNAQNEIAEQKKLIKENIEHQEIQMRERQETLFTQMQLHLSNQVASLGNEVKNKVDNEFKSDNITKLVSDKAQLRIDTIADPIISDKISKKIQPKIDEVYTSIKQIKDNIVASRENIQTLQTDSEFLSVISAAHNDDRQSFDKLNKWANDPKFYRRVDAAQAYSNILNNFEFMPDINYNVHWYKFLNPPNTDPSTLSFEKLRESFPENVGASEERIGILQYIWNRKDFSKRQKMGLLIEKMLKDDSLRVVAAASRLFQNESKQNLLSLRIELIVDWWNKNKESISDKPENALQKTK